MTKAISLRDKKKGILKLQILNTTLSLLNDYYFDEIKVKEICRLSNTSEVTFFKYFEKKEEILQYFMQVWNYKREMKISKTGRLSGKAGIYGIFEDICKTAQAEKIMLTLITYLSRLKEKPRTMNLNNYEKQILFENEKEIESMSLNDQIMRHIRECIKNRELHDSTDIIQTASLIGSIYYGTPLIAHLTGISMEKLYMENLHNIFK